MDGRMDGLIVRMRVTSLRDTAVVPRCESRYDSASVSTTQNGCFVNETS